MTYSWLPRACILSVGVMLHAQGIITTVAGTGTVGSSGNGGPATSATLGAALGVAVYKAGNIYIADGIFSVIRKVDTKGIISSFAGGGGPASLGDGGPATSARLVLTGAQHIGLAVDSAGIFISPMLAIAASGRWIAPERSRPWRAIAAVLVSEASRATAAQQPARDSTHPAASPSTARATCTSRIMGICESAK